MRILTGGTIREYWKKYPKAKQSLLSWLEEAENAVWTTPNDLKSQYCNASIINGRRVVFNIHGNAYRLIVDITYSHKLVFIVWFGTHAQYDDIDVLKVSYDKTNKN